MARWSRCSGDGGARQIFQLAEPGAAGVRNPMAEDRRAAPRQEAYVSAALETSQGRSTIAITRDISSMGLLILTRIQVAVGEVIKLTVVLGGSQHALSGKVVRLEPMEPHELWRYKVALAVDGADPVLAQLQATLAEPKPA
jgi:hypothetical protein